MASIITLRLSLDGRSPVGSSLAAKTLTATSRARSTAANWAVANSSHPLSGFLGR